jgi:hypothetical protein
MSSFDTGADPLPEPEDTPVPVTQDDDHPARRLLAHDLEHVAWDYDQEGPPPD